MILGEGEERQRLINLAEELGVRPFVDFPGFHSNPFKFMAAATVFVLCSDWEGFGNVVIEAMACGTSVVCTRYRYGAEEIITDGVNGLLVPCGSSEALAGAICALLDDGKLRARLARGARRRARDFDNAAITRKYQQVFASALRR